MDNLEIDFDDSDLCDNFPKLKFDGVQVLDNYNLDIYKRFKDGSKDMFYAPLEVKYDEIMGYYVIATQVIQANTLLGEYTGTIMRLEKSNSRDDCIMKYHSFKDINLGCLKLEELNLVINPLKKYNIARFISGTNVKRQMPNVRVIKVFDLKVVRILLLTKRRIKEGKILCYNYNGIDSDYDTHSFL